MNLARLSRRPKALVFVYPCTVVAEALYLVPLMCCNRSHRPRRCVPYRPRGRGGGAERPSFGAWRGLRQGRPGPAGVYGGACALVFARGPWAVLWPGGGRAEWPRCRDKREGDTGRAEARGGRGRERCVALRPWVLGAALKKDLDVGFFSISEFIFSSFLRPSEDNSVA